VSNQGGLRGPPFTLAEIVSADCGGNGLFQLGFHSRLIAAPHYARHRCMCPGHTGKGYDRGTVRSAGARIGRNRREWQSNSRDGRVDH